MLTEVGVDRGQVSNEWELWLFLSSPAASGWDCGECCLFMYHFYLLHFTSPI